MSPINNRPKDSELQAADGPPDPELESLIAPQGYDPELVDDVATMETPAKQARKAIRFMLILIGLLAIGFWLCTPANLVIPEGLDDPAPFDIDDRPIPPANKFLEDAVPRQVANFSLVDLKKEQVFRDPYVGATVIRATYLDEAGNPATVALIQAESYINARRLLENYKLFLEERAEITEWQERLYIDENYIQWSAPGFADQSYGLAWNNDRYFIAVTSPISATQRALAAAFPY
jgi:hypothetical protein